MTEVDQQTIVDEVTRKLAARQTRRVRREAARANHWYSQMMQATGAGCVVAAIGLLSGGAWALMAAGVALVVGAALREGGLI